MINLEILNQLINDRELRTQVSRLISNKIRADIKSLETNGLLSRRLVELSARAKNGEVTAERGALRGLIKEHLDFYDLLLNQTLAFNQRLTERLNGGARPRAAADGIVTMNLTAFPDSLIRAPFRLENNRSTPISIGFEITPFVSESGNNIVSAEVAFDPPALDLKPGQEGRIELVVAVTPEFGIGNTYLATVTVKGLEATQLLVRLHVRASEGNPVEAGTAQDAQHPSAAATAIEAAPSPAGESAEPHQGRHAGRRRKKKSSRAKPRGPRR